MALRKSDGLFILLFWICALCGYGTIAQKVDILPAHAHNDYEHERPLFEALEGKFRSVEADIFSRGDSLYVAHDARDIRPGRTLRTLYLDPLKKIVKENNLSVYRDGTPLVLLVDIKDDGLKTYRRLHDILTEYKNMLTRFTDGDMQHGAVTVIVSGNRPLEYMRGQDMRYAGYDGRIGDLNKDYPASLMPLVSDNWTNHFSWRGNGTMPIDQWAKLQGIVEKAHTNGYMLRFWATPDRPGDEREAVWIVLKEAGVDLIGTDDLKGLETWLRNNPDR